MNTHDIENAIFNIQKDIVDSTNGIEYLHICLITDGYYKVVEFCGIQLWSSEDDGRLYLDEEKDIREDIETYLRRSLNEELAKLSSIKV